MNKNCMAPINVNHRIFVATLQLYNWPKWLQLTVIPIKNIFLLTFLIDNWCSFLWFQKSQYFWKTCKGIIWGSFLLAWQRPSNRRGSTNEWFLWTTGASSESDFVTVTCWRKPQMSIKWPGTLNNFLNFTSFLLHYYALPFQREVDSLRTFLGTDFYPYKFWNP